MKLLRPPFTDDEDTIPQVPVWVTRQSGETPEDVAFLSGAALATLHLVVSREAIPQSLLRARLAMRAAETCLTYQGRPERAGELRDALAFLQPGDAAGPGGEVAQSWLRAIARPVAAKALHRALPAVGPERIAAWLDLSGPQDALTRAEDKEFSQSGAGQGSPVARAATTLQAVLAAAPRDITPALILAEAALARALGWSHVVPLLATGLARSDLRLKGEPLHAACHRAVAKAAAMAVREAADLARRAGRLRAAAPKLRAKGADDAVLLFLTHDALAPSALKSLRSDRAARRFCDRLVALGAVRELTGRESFRLYGL